MTAGSETNPPLALGRRISLVVVAIAVILALALQFAGLLVSRSHLEDAYQHHCAAAAALTAPLAEEALLTGNVYRMPALLRTVMQVHPFLTYVAVTRPDGSVLAYEYDRPDGPVLAAGHGDELPSDLAALIQARSLSAKGPGPSTLNIRTEKGDVLHVIQPLENGQIGCLHFGFLWTPVDTALRQSCLNLLAAMIAGLLISGLLAWVAYRRLMRPIARLVNAARQFGAGRLAMRVQATPGARDEVELLTTAFNQMAGRIEEHVNDLERSRAELTGEKMRIQAILDSMAQPVIVVGNDGRIVYHNNAARGLWLPEGTRLPDTYAALHADRGEIRQAFDAVMAGRSARARVNCLLGTRDLVVLISPALGRNGEALGVIEIAADVTEQIEAERAMAHAEKLNVVGQLAAGVAHEINSPLDGAIEASRIMERNASDPDKVSRFAKAQRAGLERIAAIVRTLLTFSRRPKPQEYRPVQASKLLQEAQAILKHRLSQKHVTLAMPGVPSSELIVNGDELSLVQVLVNLINNALDVTPENGVIQIGVQARSDRVDISVTDQGPGIPPDVAPRLFTPFFTTKDVGKGTGLGLATSRNIAEAHGGSIEFANLAPPWGARFTLHLPCRPGAPAAPHPQPAAAPARGTPVAHD